MGLALSIPGKPPGGGQAVLPYRLARLRLPAGQGRPAATGVKLEKPGGDVYTVDTIAGLGHGCTCPSFRLGRKHLGGKGCKHIRALLDWGLIDPAEPVRGEDQEAALAHWAEDAQRVAAEAQAGGE